MEEQHLVLELLSLPIFGNSYFYSTPKSIRPHRANYAPGPTSPPGHNRGTYTWFDKKCMPRTGEFDTFRLYINAIIAIYKYTSYVRQVLQFVAGVAHHKHVVSSPPLNEYAWKLCFEKLERASSLEHYLLASKKWRTPFTGPSRLTHPTAISLLTANSARLLIATLHNVVIGCPTFQMKMSQDRAECRIVTRPLLWGHLQEMLVGLGTRLTLGRLYIWGAEYFGVNESRSFSSRWPSLVRHLRVSCSLLVHIIAWQRDSMATHIFVLIMAYFYYMIHTI